MKPIHGKGSLCYLDSVLFVIKDWSLDLNTMTEENTKVSNNWKRNKPSKIQWSVSTTGFYNNVQDDSLLFGVRYEIQLKLTDTHYLKGDVRISSKRIVSNSDGLIECDINFESTDILTLEILS